MPNKFNVIEIVNVLVVIVLRYMVARVKDMTTMMLVLLAYGASLFGFAAIALARSKPASSLAELDTEGGGALLVKLPTLTLLGVVFTMLSVLVYGKCLSSQPSGRRFFFHSRDTHGH